MKRQLLFLPLFLMSMAVMSQSNSIIVRDYRIHVCLSAGEIILPVALTNDGTNEVGEINYKVVTDQGESKEFHLRFDEPMPVGDEVRVVDFPVRIPVDGFMPSCNLVVTKVNGKPNEASNEQTASHGNLLYVEKASPRKVLFEEFTATWCVNCPRGIVAIEKLQRLFEGSIIPVAIHCDDVMSGQGFTNLLQKVTGIPYAMVDRMEDGDPYRGYQHRGFGMENIVVRNLARMSEASVELKSASWNEAENAITLETDVVFQYNRDDAPYALGYVLVEDGLHGTGNKWAQRNNLMDNEEFAGDDDFEKFYKGSSSVKDMVYNHVAMGGWKTWLGYDGSINAPLVAGEKQTHRMVMDISKITQVQNKQALKVVALLIDRTYNRIVNADEIAVGKLLPAGMELTQSPQDNRRVIAVYSIDGRRKASMTKGLNVVKYADGRIVLVNQ